MKRFSNHLVGIDQGDVVLFSDFEDGGDMWAGHGPTGGRHAVRFGEAFRSVPAVHTSISLWDVDTKSPVRVEVTAEAIAPEGFEIVFRTWLDTRVARVRVAWMAIGALPYEDDWELY